MKHLLSCYALIIIGALTLTGCAAPINRAGERFIGTENVKLKNYEIGRSKSVNVGDSMVKFQDYWTTKTEKAVATIDRAITIKGGPIDASMIPGKKYPVVGSTVRDDVQYTLVALETGHMAMVKPDGTLRDRVGGNSQGGVLDVIFTMAISDPSAKLTKELDVQVDAKKGYENYELLYTGITSSGINITYREFSAEGMARVAFFQNLSYPSNARLITFKKYRISIDQASAENIKFTVMDDGS